MQSEDLEVLEPSATQVYFLMIVLLSGPNSPEKEVVIMRSHHPMIEHMGVVFITRLKRELDYEPVASEGPVLSKKLLHCQSDGVTCFCELDLRFGE